DIPHGKEIEHRLVRDEGASVSGSLHFSPDGRTLAWVNDVDGRQSIVLWDVASRQVRASLAGENGRFAFSPDGAKLASRGDNDGISIWDVQDAKPLLQLEQAAFPDTVPSRVFIPILLAFERNGARLKAVGPVGPLAEDGAIRAVITMPEGPSY